MSLHRQNKNGDFIYHINFLDENGEKTAAPDRATIILSTECGPGTFVAKFQKDGKCYGCKESGDGVDVFVSLSRNPIGSGRMLAEVIVHKQVEGFASGTQNLPTKTTTDVLLWDGPSDNTFTVEGRIVAAK